MRLHVKMKHKAFTQVIFHKTTKQESYLSDISTEWVFDLYSYLGNLILFGRNCSLKKFVNTEEDFCVLE